MSPAVPPLFEQDWPEGDFRFFQLGFVVDDLLGAARRWVTTFGVGPFHVMPSMTVESTHRGRPGTIELQIAVAQAGPVQIELVRQGDDTPSIFGDHLRSGRSALHQLCTVSSDVEAKLDGFRVLGYEIVTELHAPDQRVAFVDTLDDFGFYTEIVDDRPGFLADLSSIARTCAEWDGTTDPLRLLTRDGYRVP